MTRLFSKRDGRSKNSPGLAVTYPTLCLQAAPWHHHDRQQATTGRQMAQEDKPGVCRRIRRVADLLAAKGDAHLLAHLWRRLPALHTAVARAIVLNVLRDAVMTCGSPIWSITRHLSVR